MMTTISSLWSSYRELEAWKKVVLIVPLILTVFILGLVFIMTYWVPENDGDKFEQEVNRNKKKVDKAVEKNREKDSILSATDKELADKQTELEEEIKRHEEEASDIIDSIDRAAANGDSDELLRIHRRINRGR